MAYTTYKEIEADFKDIDFGSTTNVTVNNVKQFIIESDALINSYVGSVYTVPLTTEGDGLNLLKLLSRSLTVMRVKKILEVVKENAKGDAIQSVIGVLLSPAQVMKILKDIQDKVIRLEGASALVSGSGFSSYNATNDIEPTILKDTKQW